MAKKKAAAKKPAKKAAKKKKYGHHEGVAATSPPHLLSPSISLRPEPRLPVPVRSAFHDPPDSISFQRSCRA